MNIRRATPADAAALVAHVKGIVSEPVRTAPLDPDEVMPKDLQALAAYMRQHYAEAGDWWSHVGLPDLQDQALPDDLLADFKQMVPEEPAA